MNNRILIALPLAAVLALPAIAQNASSTQAQPAATSTDTATGKAPLAPPSREGFWGRVNPFARKKYVQRQTEPIRDRVNELDDLTAANGKAIKDTDSRAQAGIKLASDKADAADQHAIDAGNKAYPPSGSFFTVAMSILSPMPRPNVPDNTVTCSSVGCQ